MKHTLKTDAQTGVKSLHRDNYPLNCPFRSGVVVPGQLAGQIGIMQSPCNSSCPLFQDDSAGIITLGCSGIQFNYDNITANISKIL